MRFNMPSNPDTQQTQKSLEELKAEITKIEASLKPEKTPKPTNSLLRFLGANLVPIFLLVSSFVFFGTAGTFYYLENQLAILSGTVLNDEQKPVVRATVKLDNREVLTDQAGSFRFERLNKTQYEISIQATNYKDVNEQITLNPGKTNTKNYELQPIGFSYIVGTIVSTKKNIDDSILNSIKISGQPVTSADSPFVSRFLSGDLPVGKAVITFNSPLFKSFAMEYDLKPGENRLSLNLEPNSVYTMKVASWVDESPISEADVVIGGKSFKTNNSGIIEIQNIEDFKSTETSITKAGFLPWKSDLIQNETAVFYLVPEGKITYISDREGNNTLYSSNYDGTGEIKLTDGKGSLERVSQDATYAYFLSDRDQIKQENGFVVSQVYRVPLVGGAIEKLSNLTGYKNTDTSWTQEQVDLDARKVVYLEANSYFNTNNYSKVSIRDISGGNEKSIRNRTFGPAVQEPVQQLIISPNGQKIAYSLDRSKTDTFTLEEARILVVNADGTGNPLTVLSLKERPQYINLLGFSSDGSYLVYQVNEQSTLKTFVFNTKDSTNKQVTGVGTVTSKVLSGSSVNELFFLAQRDQQQDVYMLDLAGLRVDRVTNLGKVSRIYVARNNLVYFVNDNQIFVKRIGKSPETIGIKTNYQSWSGYNPGDCFGPCF